MNADDAFRAGALLCTAFGLACSAGMLVRLRQVRLPLGVLLDFLLAAGLLRLSASVSPRSLAVAALIVGIRKLVVFGIAQRDEPARRQALT